ncbi:hypothetical protein ACLWBD_07265 [Bdellovibrio sp. HCB117]|uniref:hypothetical protein n=1 Tax=Bdellovibrio sp. HCB117 TaxID=3394359 RepID=UPI0039B3F332
MKTFAILLTILSGSISFAGGVTCTQCPAESTMCAPRADCAEDTHTTFHCRFEDSNGQFQLLLTSGAGRDLRVDTLKGRYVSERNSYATFRCLEVR